MRTNSHVGGRGFTFLELMVVIAILAILVVFVLPNMSGTRDKAALRSASRQLASAGMLARQLAVAYNEETELVLNKEKNTWQLHLTPELKDKRERRRLSSGSRRADDPLTEDEIQRELPPRVTFNTIKLNNGDEGLNGDVHLVFYPSGACTGLTIELKNNREKSMTVDFERPTGRPDVYTGPPKSLAARMKEQGLDPANYGIPDDALDVELNKDAAGAGFSQTAGMSSDERVDQYKDAVQRMLDRSKNRYEVVKSGNAADVYADQKSWGTK
ncbi:prepilin-type N-terminal cleavage/methylation domain-containing protein [Candidatus Sumerlaeota bacterium]|nr:prepilin-type N-terminal cleavage/methylation domain-containing protein [Candidatus Sumerlaeota bacterium]